MQYQLLPSCNIYLLLSSNIILRYISNAKIGPMKIPEEVFSACVIFELKTIYAPIGNDRIIKPKTTETNAENGIPRACINLLKLDTSFLMNFYC